MAATGMHKFCRNARNANSGFQSSLSHAKREAFFRRITHYPVKRSLRSGGFKENTS
jgi:hypothetical protein